MSNKENRIRQELTNVIAHESTTLPEGACIGVYKMRAKGGATYAELQAYRLQKLVKMRLAEETSANSISTYLKLIVREIERRRGMMTKKPDEDFRSPKNIAEFVQSMAFNDMFVFHDFTATEEGL